MVTTRAQMVAGIVWLNRVGVAREARRFASRFVEMQSLTKVSNVMMRIILMTMVAQAAARLSRVLFVMVSHRVVRRFAEMV